MAVRLVSFFSLVLSVLRYGIIRSIVHQEKTVKPPIMGLIMYQKDSHCSYCGRPFRPDAPWPRICTHCGRTTYRNPLPVAVVLLPIDDEGLLVVRRNIDP